MSADDCFIEVTNQDIYKMLKGLDDKLSKYQKIADRAHIMGSTALGLVVTLIGWIMLTPK